MPANLPDRIDPVLEWTEKPPNPLDRPDFYDGLLWRRSLAFCIDAALMFSIAAVFFVFNILTFFIFTALLAVFWIAPMFIVYDMATIGSNASATFGMRWLGLEMRSWDGGKPSYLHVLISSALFWFLVPLTGGLILLVGVFSNRRRQVHDILSGTVVINTTTASNPTVIDV